MRVPRKVPRSGAVWYSIVAASLVLLLWGCGDAPPGDTRGSGIGAGDEGAASEQAAEAKPVGVIGGPFPEYWAPTLEGEPVAISSLAGEVVFLNVWATWCPPCRREMPSLQALHERFADRGLRVVGVSIDAEGSEDEIRDFLEEVGVTYTILHDPDERISELMPIIGVPHTFLIGRNGTFLRQWIGEIDATSVEIVGPVKEALAASVGEQR